MGAGDEQGAGFVVEDGDAQGIGGEGEAGDDRVDAVVEQGRAGIAEIEVTSVDFGVGTQPGQLPHGGRDDDVGGPTDGALTCGDA